MMRVLLITWACDLDDVSEPGVAAKWVQQLSKDHEITLFAVSKPERFGCVKRQFPNLEVFEWKDIRVPRSLERFRAIVKPGYFLYYFRARRFLKKLLSERQFDVIHHLSPFAWRYPSPAFGLGVPFIRGPVAGGVKSPPNLEMDSRSRFHPFMFLRRTDDFRKAFDPLLRLSYSKSDHVFLAAPYVKDVLDKIEFQNYSIEIEHGLSNEDYPSNNICSDLSHDTINLLYVGRVIQTKGLFFAIRALAQISSKYPVCLTVVGEGDDFQRCLIESERLGLVDKVKFVGWLDKNEVSDYYRTSDIFLFPSYREPTGGVLLEAMAHGLPSITCSHGGADYLIDETCGIKVSPESQDSLVSGLTEAIDLLISDVELRKKLSHGALIRAKNVFGWEAKRTRVTDLYLKVSAAK